MPIGAVVVGADGTELARAVNAREALGDPTAHAEILAMRAAARVLGDGWRLQGATLAVTVEPCTMCAGALVLARVDAAGIRRLGTQNRRGRFAVGRGARSAAQSPPGQVRGGVLAQECAAPLEAFFARQRLG